MHRRILHLGKYYDPFSGGIEQFTRSLSEAQVANGNEVVCLVHNHKRSLKTHRTKIRGVEVIRVPVIATLLFSPIALTYPAVLSATLKAFKPTIVHVHMPNLSVFWLLPLMSKTGAKIVVHWHADVMFGDSRFLMRLAYSLYGPLEKLLLKHSAKIIATSPVYADTSRVLAGFKSKTVVVPLGLEDMASGPVDLNEVPQVKNEEFQLICVGRFSYYKGHRILLDAIRDIEGVKLVLVGKGPEEEAIRTRIARNSIASVVEIKQGLSDANLLKLLEASDCLVLPSIERTEAFGVVILEAMRAAKPVIASRVEGSGMGWVVDNGVTGLLVTPGNVSELIKAICELRDDRLRAEQMGESGRLRFLDKFVIHKIVDSVESIYAEILY